MCSGIEAATVAWHPLGWEPAAFSEIDKFPRTVLQHHYPSVPLHGDFTTIQANQYGPVELIVGGTPCQSFSVAGLRGGLDDDRGNLALEFARLAARIRPRWIVWENVPGVLSSNGGRDFGSILGAMGELGYGWAYRVLDAQHFGVPQRRRRVFVVGCLGSTARAAAVLFERHSLQGHPAPRRKAGKEVAVGAEGCIGERSVAQRLTTGTGQRYDPETETLIAFGWQNSAHQGLSDSTDVFPTLDKSKTPAVAAEYYSHDYCQDRIYSTDGIAPAINCTQQHKIRASGVRRLTPRECERLQGFPDDYTLVPHNNKPVADGPRYKAIGNSMAVPVMRWIGQRIQAVEEIT